ncbi:DNA alkylation repair protein [Leucobacter zeae]|nr:DNA alkylation repair protein [Leucobacter zeae]
MSMTDDLLGIARVSALIEALEEAVPDGALPAMRAAASDLERLTLSGRAKALAAALLADLDGAYAPTAAAVRRATARADLVDWVLWPAGLAVALGAVAGHDGAEHDGAAGDGASHDHAAFDDALDVLRELTPRMTSEFSMRPLLRHDPERALARMSGWVADPDWNVRRLASEGTRPLLPWGERVPALVADPELTRPILDALHDDPSESVRRSVANHLNDHSRRHPEFAVATARGWLSGGGEHAPRTARHALRTLVKRGDPEALALLGFPPVDVAVAPLELDAHAVPNGASIRFRSTIENVGDADARLVIDYALTFPDARGRERSKVFKIAQRVLAPGERTEVIASHSFRPITTRRYYPGSYAVALQMNGALQRRAEFSVLDPTPLDPTPLDPTPLDPTPE